MQSPNDPRIVVPVKQQALHFRCGKIRTALLDAHSAITEIVSNSRFI